MPPAQQKNAAKLLTQALQARDRMDAGDSIDVAEDDKLTLDIRVFLIQIGAIPDRRRKRGANRKLKGISHE